MSYTEWFSSVPPMWNLVFVFSPNSDQLYTHSFSLPLSFVSWAWQNVYKLFTLTHIAKHWLYRSAEPFHPVCEPSSSICLRAAFQNWCTGKVLSFGSSNPGSNPLGGLTPFIVLHGMPLLYLLDSRAPVPKQQQIHQVSTILKEPWKKSAITVERLWKTSIVCLW